MKKITLFTLFLLITGISKATTCESTNTPFGLWSTNGTWDCGTAPSAGNCVDTIVIGEHVYVDEIIDLTGCPPVVLIVNDTLRFKSGKKLKLPEGSSIIVHVGGYLVPEGGGGNSNQITIDQASGPDDVFWNAGDGTFAGSSNLDIELTSFYASQLDASVQLYWTTASEINNDFFTVERSKDGSNFESIGSVNGAGNSSSEIDYSFLDNKIFNGIIYYRLTQTDYDGSVTFSEIAKVIFPNEVEIKIYPNPATEFFSIQGKLVGNVSIYTSTGRIVKTIENYGGEFISVEYLDRGIYLITYVVDTKMKTVKLVLK